MTLPSLGNNIKVKIQQEHTKGLIIQIDVGHISLVYLRKRSSCIFIKISDIKIFCIRRNGCKWGKKIKTSLNMLPIISDRLREILFIIFTTPNIKWKYLIDLIGYLTIECYKIGGTIDVNCHQNNGFPGSQTIRFENGPDVSVAEQSRIELSNLITNISTISFCKEIIEEYSLPFNIYIN